LNKRQKKEDFDRYKQEKKQESIKSKQLKKSIKQLFNPPKRYYKGYSKDYYEKNKEKICEMTSKWAKSNKVRHLENCRKYYLINKDYINNKRKTNRLADIEYSKRNERIIFWRRQQSKLALEMLKKWQKEACIGEIFISPPTFLLS